VNSLPDDRPVCVIVRARARAGRGDDVSRELMAIADRIRANPDCLDYRVYRDREDPDGFVFWERWTSEEAGEENLRRDYMRGYLARCDELYEQRTWEIYLEVHPVEEAF
jgi:quinol monooxygenase YgiN